VITVFVTKRTRYFSTKSISCLKAMEVETKEK